ncbi:hypothetical protein MPTK1_4g17950 [Marchantia polymorpha subsp. ruderalis]|uniref:C2 domain-containing protein n=2 Tax=Marchantia polymorpha TaxID=3197 RepID=A0A176WJ56_MARPO|nr:hypothetical protein AXG93_1793s1400 [Marchantia polymorpha subsp. ruderalis]PTQ40182.1 hypothetical protein MARPO_0041s0076 [Marchantia polymorpha]PTQ40183.1 hypothetical protein MARPO_0041s0076 [Marchantia polymorpha]BBN09194.1 hypothetical protein Mp_4g17950 [Marchantia polymorpha subsp. ruderalis]BBN09195.1 hypothetical protein Mp_4g17950 [Marchantia polymorpha subsp. ruderalis]|eukprot:PTQ40182.1 hypothetical protein MARPO_0041s0076 [Marchantia polymorpha]
MASRNASVVTTGRTQDDTGILNKEVFKYASVRVPLATSAALLPFFISGMLWVSTFTPWSQFLLGGCLGVIVMFSFQLFQIHRSTVRRHKALQVAQLSELISGDVKRIIQKDDQPNWVKFSEFEKVEWLNKELAEVWPFLDKAVSGILREQVEPVLEQYAFGIIEKLKLKNLTLGNRAPRFDGIKITEGALDECVIETQFQWDLEKENLVLKIHTPGPDFEVKVKDLHVSGILKFILKPLLNEVPGFGAVLLSFSEAPDLDFNLKFLGGDIGALPGVEKLIDDSIRSALLDTMVWPCRIVVPIAKGDFSYLDLRPVGELDVTLVEVNDIMKTDVIGKSDPFVMFYVRQKADKIKRSSTKNNKKHAVWNEGFILEVEDQQAQTLTVRLMDEESIEKAQYIGSAEYPLSQMKPGVAVDVWLDMVENPHSTLASNPRGRAHLLMIYKPFEVNTERVNKGNHEKEDLPLSSFGDEPHI